MSAATPYIPPVADYAFLYGELFGRDIVSDASGGAITADDAVEIIAGAGEFAAEMLAPLDRAGDQIGARLEDGEVRLPNGFAEAYRALVESGWVSATAPDTAGGDGLPESVGAGLGEIWNSANMAFALCWMLGTGAIHALDAAASEDLRETYLTKLVSGEWTGTMNLTEPEAGTDLGAIRTLATPRGDGSYAITGQKIFITWGDHDIAENIVHLVLARTPGAPEGAKGLSLFVAPRRLVNADGSLGERNAITTVALEHKLGIHASPTCVLAYEDATGYLVGELHGGLAGMFVMMNSARVGMGHQATGISERALQGATAYAAGRLQGPVIGRPAGTPIAGHPDVARILRSMSSQTFAMRALSVHVGDLFDRAAAGEDVLRLAELFVPILKGWASEETLRVTSDGIQVYGGMGFIDETGAAQHYRDARIIPIYEGTTAIQANDLIGRKVIRDGGATVSGLLEAIAETAATVRETDAVIADALDRAVAAARRATESLISFGAGRDSSSVAVPYLMLLGTLAGGWMHALAVIAVAAHDTAHDDDADRKTDARFYIAHHLPRVHALAETVAAGEIG
ncbi:acyl-CoA dehydrogenase [uncultured Microbacterium sp.]|uniref:acyl-CoA dehydrogenase n=1 Tax=uncultured Microbacterium sp. TaxID=191216 RepID=UPI002620D58B|nr:acyl-CoA dehydrogenase [uncultured Microbacterium sp.]